MGSARLTHVCLALGLWLMDIHPAAARAGEVRVTVGQSALLPCRVDYDGNVQVMWQDEAGTTLTLNERRVTADDRYSVEHPYLREWNLRLDGVRTGDAGVFTCLISSTPVSRKQIILAVDYAPEMTFSSDDVTAPVGSDVTLECRASGSPEPVISWIKHTFSENQTAVGSGQFLRLSNVTRLDGAIYECAADNGIRPSTSARVTVTVDFPPVLYLPHQQIRQEVGHNTVLECFVAAQPVPSYRWLRGGVVVEESDKHRQEVWERDRYTQTMALFVYDLQQQDFGSYTCAAENEFGTANASMTLYEWQTGQLRMLSQPHDVITSETDAVQFNCTVTGMGHKDNLIWWRRLVTGERQMIFQSHQQASAASETRGSEGSGSPGLLDSDKYEIRGHYNLVVRDVVAGDAGTYTCEVVGHENHTAGLTVVEPLGCFNSNDSFYMEGDSAILWCAMNYSGPAPTWHVAWQHGDRKLSAINNDVTGRLMRTVTLAAREHDAGVYQCLVSSLLTDFSRTCDTTIHVKHVEFTPAPVCTGTGGGGATGGTAGMIAGLAGGCVAVLFLVVLVITCCHYQQRIRTLKRAALSVRYEKNGQLSLETDALTSPEDKEVDV